MATELANRENGVIEQQHPTSGLALSFAEMTMRVAQLDQFYREVMQEGTDYGKIPGTDKPTLYQPGAQMLDQIFGYAPFFDILPSSVIDWNRPIPFFHYIVICRLVSRRSSEVVAQGIGSANSMEDRYRWRTAKRVCPACNTEAIIKGKQEYGGGWLCFKKGGGCGAKFRDGDAAIEGQKAGRVENEDTASLENTLSKMAQKRAHIAATLNATGASRIFTQDIEDLPQFQNALVVESSSRPVADDDAPFGPTDIQGPAATPPASGASPRSSSASSTPAQTEASDPVKASAVLTGANPKPGNAFICAGCESVVTNNVTILKKKDGPNVTVAVPDFMPVCEERLGAIYCGPCYDERYWKVKAA